MLGLNTFREFLFLEEKGRQSADVLCVCLGGMEVQMKRSRDWPQEQLDLIYTRKANFLVYYLAFFLWPALSRFGVWEWRWISVQNMNVIPLLQLQL
jgi:hypothetical protein